MLAKSTLCAGVVGAGVLFGCSSADPCNAASTQGASTSEHVTCHDGSIPKVSSGATPEEIAAACHEQPTDPKSCPPSRIEERLPKLFSGGKDKAILSKSAKMALF